MADILSVTKDGEILIQTDKYTRTLKPGGTATRNKEVADAVFKYIEDNAAKIGEDKKFKDALLAVADQFEAMGLKAEKVSALKGALTFKKLATVEETTAGLIKNSLARKMLKDSALHGMGIEDVAKLDSLIEARGKIAEYAKDVTANKASVRSLLIKHGLEDRTIKEAVFGKSDGKFKGIIDELNKDVSKVAEKFEEAYGKIKAIDAQIEAAEKAGAKEKVLKKLAEKRAAQVEKMVEVTKGKDFAGMLFEGMKKVDEKLFDELKEVDSKLASHIETSIKNGLGAAGKDVGGNKWYSIFKGENALAETAKKEGVAVKDLGFFKKIRPGKTAAIAGIAAVGAYFVAGMGNRGPGERAESANRGQSQGQAAGIGA